MNEDGHSGRPPAHRERRLIEAARRQISVRGSGTTQLHPHAGPADDSNAAGYLPPPATIPGYDILREIHRGGQGVVYQALQRSTKRKVAIKVLREGPFAGPRERGRFEREVQVLGQLNHRNIVAVHDSGQAGGSFYIVMDYISGRPLDRFIADHTLSIAEKLELGARICEAVHAAHLRGIIHRDIKPGNIRIDDTGEPHILDFGLAKITTTAVTGEPEPRVMSQTGQFIGSLPWASPEQAEGHPERIDIRTDVYSLGVVLYQVLAGRFPYPVSGPIGEVLCNIVHTAPARPSTIRLLKERIDDEAETILLKCLNKDPERRYQTAGELARDIRRYLAREPIEAKRDTPLANWYMLRKTLRRYRAPAAILSAFGVLVVVFAVTMTWMYGRAERQAHRAELTAGFLEETLTAIDPNVARGARLTALTEVLDATARRAEDELASEPEVQAAVRDVLGRTYLKLGAYDAAEEHLRAALAARQALLGDEHPDTAASVNHLAAWWLEARSEYARAEELAGQALAVRRALLEDGAVSPEAVADSLNILAWALKKQGRFAPAEKMYREALEIRTALYGPEHEAVAEIQNNLAQSLRESGQRAEAEELFRAALATRRKVLGAGHTHVATSEANLGLLLLDHGEDGRAEELLRSALATREQLLGDHPATVVNMNMLALLLKKRGELAEAETLARQALQSRRRLLGPRHEFVAVSMHTLALVLHARQHYGEAEDLFSGAIGLWRELLGDRHPHVASGLNNLARSYRERGELDAAEECCREALEIREEVLPDHHPRLGDSYLLAGQLAMDRGEFERAEPLLRSCLEIYRTAWSEGHYRTARARGVLGACLAELGRDEEAETALLESLEALRGSRGPDDPQTAEARQRVVEFYQDRGDLDAAASFEAAR